MSKLFERAVDELSRLPGIGERSAMRLALHLLNQPVEDAERFTRTLDDFRKNIKFCRQCNNLSDTELCPICADPYRDRSTVCVVEQVKDLLSIEHTGCYKGLYHVLGGVISPMQGIAPSDLKIDLLTENIRKGEIKEVILAIGTSVEGETTSYYISRKLKELDIRISNIARGVGFGDELDYTDELTLIHSLNNRTRL